MRRRGRRRKRSRSRVRRKSMRRGEGEEVQKKITAISATVGASNYKEARDDFGVNIWSCKHKVDW